MRSRIVVPVLGALCLVLSLAFFDPAASTDHEPKGRFSLGAADDTTTPFNLTSVPALIKHKYDGRDLRLVRLLSRNGVRERWRVAYTGDGLRLTGTLYLPRSPGPHPVVVSAHGYIPPPDYRSGLGLLREEERFARLGYVVLHPDYRNFGGSDRKVGDPATEPLGYAADVLNAITALTRAHIEGVDVHRIVLFGRSMGGGVALQVAVARPQLFAGLVMYSPVSSDATQNFDRWVADDSPLRERVEKAYGTPKTNPSFWHRASVINYVDRLGHMPVEIHHGTKDPMCPLYWSFQTAGALRAAGVPVSLYTYSGEPHRFNADWPAFMKRVDAFARAHT